MKRVMVMVVVVVGVLMGVVGQTLAESGTITAAGEQEIRKMPEAVRLTVQVSAEGPNIREALEKLSERREQLREGLRGLEAREESIAFGDPVVGAQAGGAQQQQMMRMMRMMGQSSPAMPKDKVIVSSLLEAEWPLEAEDAEALLVRAHELQEQVRQALAEHQRELSPEEQEIMEEMMGYGMMDEMGEPGQPKFVYVAQITEAEQAEAIRAAFAQARSEAARSASAAGLRQGAVRQMSVIAASDPVDEDDFGYAFYMRAMGGDSGTATVNRLEAVGLQPGKLKYTVTVTAAFELETP